MRISDWSSDVCSSDLDADGEEEQQHCGQHDIEGKEQPEDHDVRVTAGLPFSIALAAGPGHVPGAATSEPPGFRSSAICLVRLSSSTMRLMLGKAACRERVCKDVYISVGPDSLK